MGHIKAMKNCRLEWCGTVDMVGVIIDGLKVTNPLHSNGCAYCSQECIPLAPVEVPVPVPAGHGRSLSDAEINALYPGVPINRAPMTQDEKYARMVRNQKARKSDYRSTVGFRE